jgi:PleD family two-component response regulator
MNILIVDDEPGTRLMVATAVTRLGHGALQASDGAEAWAKFAREPIDVVITDWSMPGLDGTQLTARIRADGRSDYTYIMVLTGRADEGASREAVRAGADDVLAKPLDVAQLERGLIAAERITTLHRRIRDEARRDPLTGAGTRLRLREDLVALCARVVRYGHAYSVAMVGVDPAGDDVARAAGRALTETIRSGDVLYRYDTGQFTVLLPEQGLESANLAGTRLRLAVESAVGSGVSVGVGIVTTGGECEPDDLLARAQAALASALAPGGGGVVGAEESGGGGLRLLVADDDPVSRLMLAAIVRREPDFELVGEAADAIQAIELAVRRRPDVVLLDVSMPGGGGARAAVEIREALPDVRIVAISADDSQITQYDMVRAGAVGFIAKGAPGDEILRVIRSSARW